MSEPTPRGLSFGAVAERYERFRPGYPDELVDLLLRDSPATAVEVGAGTGKATRSVAARGVAVEAVEPDPGMAAVLRRTTRDLPVTVVESTLEALGPREPVDLLFSAAAWHWTDEATRWERAAALLRPGGTFACLGGPLDLADPDLAQAVEEVRGEATRGVRVRSASREHPSGLLWPGDELTDTPLFTDVEQHELTWTGQMDAEELVGHLSTVSAFLVHPDGEALLARVRALLPEVVGVRRDLTLHLARRAHQR